LVEEIGFASGLLAPNDGKEAYYLIIYKRGTYEILSEAYYQLQTTSASQLTLTELPLPERVIDHNHLLQRECLQMLRALSLEIESFEWFPSPPSPERETETVSRRRDLIVVSYQDEVLICCVDRGGLSLYRNLTVD
jgi:hypothetical protein